MINQVCAYYHRGTFPSANVSSLLCSEAFQHEPGWASTGAISQMPEPPQQHDLHCLSPSYSITVENTVKCLADDLGSPNLTQRPLDNLRSESTVRPTGGLDRTMLGIPTSTPLSLQPSLEDVMDQVVASFRDLLYNQTSSPDRILQALQHIETIKNFFGSKLSLPSTSSTGSSERGRKLFQCWQCDPQKDKTTFSKFGTFKRHLTKHDILDCGWRCPEPGCSVVVHRRDKMHDHLLLKHKKISLTPANVEATRERYPHPPSCRFCSRKISSWFMYFKHIKYHCLIPTGSTNAPTDEDWSCHGDNGGGNVGYGDSHCHGSSFAGPSNSNGDTSLTDQANGLGGLTDSSISSERFGSVGKARPGLISHSVSDDELRPIFN